MTVDPDLQGAAQHEAGHFVAAWRLGLPSSRVGIREAREPAEGKPGFTAVSVDGSTSLPLACDITRRHELLATPEPWVVAILAGREAERVFGRALAETRADPHQNGPSDVDRALEIMSRMRRSTGAYAHHCRGQARRLVEQNSALIARLAEVLLERHELAGDEARALLDSWEVHWS